MLQSVHKRVPIWSKVSQHFALRMQHSESNYARSLPSLLGRQRGQPQHNRRQVRSWGHKIFLRRIGSVQLVYVTTNTVAPTARGAADRAVQTMEFHAKFVVASLSMAARIPNALAEQFPCRNSTGSAYEKALVTYRPGSLYGSCTQVSTSFHAPLGAWARCVPDKPSPCRTAVRATFEMTSTLSLRATRVLVRRRSSCSR